jgi:hypothetical protein
VEQVRHDTGRDQLRARAFEIDLDQVHCGKPYKKNSTIMEFDHEKTQCACDYRWRRVIGCGALLGSVVARKERGAIA